MYTRCAGLPPATAFAIGATTIERTSAPPVATVAVPLAPVVAVVPFARIPARVPSSPAVAQVRAGQVDAPIMWPAIAIRLVVLVVTQIVNDRWTNEGIVPALVDILAHDLIHAAAALVHQGEARRTRARATAGGVRTPHRRATAAVAAGALVDVVAGEAVGGERISGEALTNLGSRAG